MSQPAEKRMGVSDARANMTDVIAEVRLLGTPVVLTRREKPQAVLVPVDFYERAAYDRAFIEHLRGMAGLPAGVTAEAKPDIVHTARIVHEALEKAERDVDAARNTTES